MLAGAAVASAVGLVFQILRDLQKRYLAVLERLHLIAELNHHIRNALQVILSTNVLELAGHRLAPHCRAPKPTKPLQANTSVAVGCAPKSR